MNRSKSMSFVRALWFASVVLIGLIVAVRIWRLAIAAGPWDVVDLVFDDAYYYLTVAANTVESGRSTLDGSTLTNGYQPLWFALITLLGFVIGTDSMRFFAGFVALICVIVLGAVLAGAPLRNSPTAVVRSALAVGMATAVVFLPPICLWGMETVLVLPLVIPLVLFMERRLDNRTALWLSGLFTLAFLVRLDALSLLPAYVLVVVVIEPWILSRFEREGGGDLHGRTRWRALPRIFTIVVPAVLCYGIFNLVVYGTPVPVSGLAKGIGPHFENFGLLYGYVKAFMFLLPVIIIWAVAEVIAFKAGVRSTQLLRSLSICVLACCLQAAYYVVASTWRLWEWYYYFFALIMILIAARVVILGSELWERNWRPRAAGVASLVIAMTTFGVAVDLYQTVRLPPAPPASIADGDLTKYGPKYTFNEISLLMFRDIYPATAQRGDRIAMGDRAGGLSYWGRNTVEVVHTEGLLLGYAYIEARRTGTATDYLSKDPRSKYYVVDREHIPTVTRENGEVIYLVADPIQALETDATYQVSLFCFPQKAIRYQLRYDDRQFGPSQRLVFSFDQRVECTQEERTLIHNAVKDNELRKLSLSNTP
jgi:hypothetical protein